MVSTVMELSKEQLRRENELAKQWSGLVPHCVNKMVLSGKVPKRFIDDAISAAFFGLSNACRHYRGDCVSDKTSRPVQFNTYACHCIFRAISREMKNLSKLDIIFDSDCKEKFDLDKECDPKTVSREEIDQVQDYQSKFNKVMRRLTPTQEEIFRLYTGTSQRFSGRFTTRKIAEIYKCDNSKIKRIIDHVLEKLGGNDRIVGVNNWNKSDRPNIATRISEHDLPNQQLSLFEEVA